MSALLRAALDDLEARPVKPRALALTATPLQKNGRSIWIAGGDLKELAALPNPGAGLAYAMALSDFLNRLDQLPIPVVIAVDGDAIGGGAEFAIAGDIRLATRASRLSFRQLRVGLATGYGSARRLVDLVGLSRAQDLLFGERTVTADEAHAIGLVHEVLADGEALASRLKERFHTLESLGPDSLAAQKCMFWHATQSHPGAARAAESTVFGALWGNPSHRRFLEGFKSR